MKKVILGLGLVTLLASCGNEGETKEVTTDSTEVVVDSTNVVDSTSAVVDSTKEVK